MVFLAATGLQGAQEEVAMLTENCDAECPRCNLAFTHPTMRELQACPHVKTDPFAVVLLQGYSGFPDLLTVCLICQKVL
jgi:hypothetical protein